MKIAVCFKLIPDYDHVPSDSWKASGFLRIKDGLTDTKYVKKIFGFFDEGALETGLRAKDQCPSLELEAVSLGKEDRIFTEALYSAGYDKVTYIEGNSDFDSKNTAHILGDYIKQNGFDLVLTGEVVGPLDSGSVPYLMANYLGCSVVSKVSGIDTESILCGSGYGAICGTPLIAIISNAKYPYLRFATYDKKEKAKEKEANHLKAIRGKKNVKFLSPKESGRTTQFVQKEFLGGYLSERFGGSL